MNIMLSPLNIGSMKTNFYGNSIKLEGLQVESSIFNYKVVKPVGGISKSVSPDSTGIIFWLIILNLFYARNNTSYFDDKKRMIIEIRVDTNILIMHCVVLDKNK
jgi:hypothetical protein